MNHICRGVPHDFRYGLRQWWRAPWFTTIAVVVLALGMGATLALFGILDALVLRHSQCLNRISWSRVRRSIRNIPSTGICGN